MVARYASAVAVEDGAVAKLFGNGGAADLVAGRLQDDKLVTLFEPVGTEPAAPPPLSAGGGTTTSAAPSWGEPCERFSASSAGGRATRAFRAGQRRGRYRAAVRGAVNLSLHIHALVVDGCFGHDATGLRFYPAAALDAADVDEVLATVEAYLQRLLPPQGLEETDAGGSTVDEWAEEAPVLAGLAAASVQGRVALGSRPAPGSVAAAPPWPPSPTLPRLGPCQARHNGFDLHAALCVPAGQRDRLERVCRYALRPPLRRTVSS